MSLDDDDIRRRNVCREVIIVNKSALVSDFNRHMVDVDTRQTVDGVLRDTVKK
jgi:hypothetical protein